MKKVTSPDVTIKEVTLTDLKNSLPGAKSCPGEQNVFLRKILSRADLLLSYFCICSMNISPIVKYQCRMHAARTPPPTGWPSLVLLLAFRRMFSHTTSTSPIGIIVLVIVVGPGPWGDGTATSATTTRRLQWSKAMTWTTVERARSLAVVTTRLTVIADN